MSNAPGARPTKNERREQAREQARLLREEAKKRERRNRILLQSGIIVGVIAIALVITLVIINNVKPAGPGPANMASGGVLLVQDKETGGIKVQPTAALPDGEDPVDSTSTAQIRIQTFIDLTCPVCQSFEIGLDYDGSGDISQDELDKYNERNGTSATDDPSTLGDYIGNLTYMESLVEQGVASLEIFPVAILDRSYNGTKYSTRAANAFDAIAAGDPDHLLDFVKAMYEQQPEEGTDGLTDDQIVSIASGAGVDLTAAVSTDQGSPTVEQAIRDQTFKNWVASMTNRAKSFGFSAEANVDQSNGFGTPTVVVNGEQYTASTWASTSEFKSFILTVGDAATSTPTDSASPTP